MFPKTVGELALIRFWLGVLSKAYFEDMHMRSFFNPQIPALLFSKDKPFRLHCSNKMDIWDIQIIAAFGQHICASSIEINSTEEQNRDELFQFLCSTCVVPKMVYIKHSDLIPNDCDYIIQVF
jgi:hypothetical protein